MHVQCICEHILLVDRELHESRDFCLSGLPMINPEQSLEQCLVYNKGSINICFMNILEHSDYKREAVFTKSKSTEPDFLL